MITIAITAMMVALILGWITVLLVLCLRENKRKDELFRLYDTAWKRGFNAGVVEGYRYALDPDNPEFENAGKCIQKHLSSEQEGRHD
jgi:hypothetical protein